MNSYVRESVDDDLWHVAEDMRVEDVEEVMAAGHDPYYALYLGFCNGKSYTLVDPDGWPAGMLGVVPQPAPDYRKRHGVVWLLGTPSLVRWQYRFLKHSKPVLDELMQDYDILYNQSYYKNEVHHKWLKCLGFTLMERQGDWIPFYKEKI